MGINPNPKRAWMNDTSTFQFAVIIYLFCHSPREGFPSVYACLCG